MEVLNKIKDVRRKTQNSINTPSLRRLDENIFPYSCLVDDDVLLTKNGEVLQIIEILLDDFKLNQEGGLRDTVRTAISQNIGDFKTAFWVQTVKRKKIHNQVVEKELKYDFLKYTFDMQKEYENTLNDYITTMYITVVRQGRSFDIKYFKDYIFSSILGHIHNKYVDKITQEVKEITSSIMNILKPYNPRLLGVKKNENGDEYSEILEVLYFIVNFSEKKIPICPIDATKLLNNSKYLFENGILAIQNDETLKTSFAMSFSLKEVPRVNMSNVADIVNNTRAEFIITEYISYVDEKVAISQFKTQKSFLSGRKDTRFLQEAGLSFLDSKNNPSYSQSSISIMVLAGNTSELSVLVSDVIKMFSKHGIVMAREDVSLERNYYAMMPANFAFTHRLTIHDGNEVGCFCYSYIPQENSPEQFLDNKVLFKLGTLKNNPVPIGLDKQKSNVIVCGNANSGKTVMSNFLASSILCNFDVNVYIIEFHLRSRVFIDAIGGQCYRASMDKQLHDAVFNILNTGIFDNDESLENYLIEVISMLLVANNASVESKKSGEIIKICKNIVNYTKDHKKIALHDVRQIFKETALDQDLQCWHSIGRYYYLFDNREDIFDTDGNLALYIDETIVNNRKILSLIINHVMLNIIQKAKNSKKPAIIILEDPFIAFGDEFFKSKIDKFIQQMAENNVYCIFKISDISAESATIVDFTSLISSCGLQLHFANRLADLNYGRVFKMSKLENVTVKTLAGYNGRNLLVKQSNGLFSCSFELSKWSKVLNILSDTGDTQKQVFKIKEALRTDNCNRWVSAFFNSFETSESAKERRKLQQELKAIKDVQRLMEN